MLDGPMTSRLGTIVQELVTGEPATESSDLPGRKSTAGGSETRADKPFETTEHSQESRRGSRRKNRRPDSMPNLSPAAAAIVADPILIDEPVVRVPRPGIGVIIRRTFTPFRLLMLSAIVLVMATGWWVVAQRRSDEARKVWRREMDVAENALKEKDLTALEASLAKAVLAAETLNRDDPESRRAAGLLQQTRAVQDLSSADLVSLLSGNLTVNGTLSLKKAAAAADSLRSKLFVFDCAMLRSGDELLADIPLAVDSVTIVITIASDRLERAVTAMPQSPLLFVGTVESAQLVEERREFHIRLQDHTWSLITTEFHAAQLGFTPTNTPGLAALIKRQAEFLNSEAASTRFDSARVSIAAHASESAHILEPAQ